MRNESHDRQLAARDAITSIGVFKVSGWRRKDEVTKFLCHCPFCGSQKWATKKTAATSKSCGCQLVDLIRAARTIHGHAILKTRTYRSWKSMNDRCHRESHKSYADYGGRGITVCDRWRESFVNFLADLGERPAGTTLGRKDNNWGYSPDNCEWQTYRQQARNKRSNNIITYNGESLTLQDWSERVGISADILSHRLKDGWPIGRAFTEPPRRMSNSRHYSQPGQGVLPARAGLPSSAAPTLHEAAHEI